MDNISCFKNLKLLWWLRNIALAGQAIAVFAVTEILNIPLIERPLWLIVSLLLLVNVATWVRIKNAADIKEPEFFCQLLIDISALFGLLYFTGGATNPFASLFILQVIIAAITLSPIYTWLVAAITIALYTTLMFWNIEVPYFMHHHIDDFFSLHVQGMWISFILLAGIVSWFAVRMNVTIKRQNFLLAEAEKIAAIGTLAAHAAHELGTPLATLTILAEDYNQNITADERNSKAEMFRLQLMRCKQILSRITAAGGVMRAESGKPMQLDLFLKDMIATWKKEHPSIPLTEKIPDNKPLRIIAETGLAQAIMNLLDNAAEASPHYVNFQASWVDKTLSIIISDKGNGISPDIKNRLGEAGNSNKPGGMGIGLFLAKSVIARVGGTLDIESPPEKGTNVKITIPLSRLTI